MTFIGKIHVFLDCSLHVETYLDSEKIFVYHSFQPGVANHAKYDVSAWLFQLAIRKKMQRFCNEHGTTWHFCIIHAKVVLSN